MLQLVKALLKSKGLLSVLSLVLIGSCLCLAIGWQPVAASNNAPLGADWVRVKRGDFEILCREEGELRPIKVTTLTFMRWGKLSFMLPEGTQVRKGDRVLALDTKDLEDQLQRLQEDLTAQEKLAAEQAQTRELEIKRLQTELAAERDRAALAELKQKKVLARPTELEKRAADNEIGNARARMASANAKFSALAPLAEKGFASKADLATRRTAREKAELELKRAELKHTLAMEGATAEERERVDLERCQAAEGLTLKELDYEYQADVLNSKVATAKRDLDSTRRRRDSIREQLSRSTVLAPHDGIVVHRFLNNKKVEVGDIVGPWASPVDLPSYDRMKVRTQVPESFIRALHARVDASREGRTPKAGSPARVALKTVADATFEAEVIWIDEWSRDRNSNLSDADIKAQGLAGVRVFNVEVEIGQCDPQRLREGFRTDVEFPIETLRDVISIPVNAVASRDGCPHVKILNGSSSEWRKVELGARSLDRVIVTAGLSEIDAVFVGNTQQQRRSTPQQPKGGS